jgi:hypothetical protein
VSRILGVLERFPIQHVRLRSTQTSRRSTQIWLSDFHRCCLQEPGILCVQIHVSASQPVTSHSETQQPRGQHGDACTVPASAAKPRSSGARRSGCRHPRSVGRGKARIIDLKMVRSTTPLIEYHHHSLTGSRRSAGSSEQLSAETTSVLAANPHLAGSQVRRENQEPVTVLCALPADAETAAHCCQFPFLPITLRG